MTPPIGDTPDDFVTVGVAAKRLGVADRTDQRYAAKLSDSDRQVSDTEKSIAGDAQAAFVAQLQGEVQYLRDAPKAEQENTRAAFAELHDARREGQMIMGAVAAGRIQLPAQETEGAAATTATEEAQDVPGDNSDKASAVVGVLESEKPVNEGEDSGSKTIIIVCVVVVVFLFL